MISYMTFKSTKMTEEEKKTRDYFAAQAMLAVMQETQEMKIASFKDWVKQQLVQLLGFTFLTVKFVKVENVYEEASQRAYEYADAMMAEKKKTEVEDEES